MGANPQAVMSASHSRDWHIKTGPRLKLLGSLLLLLGLASLLIWCLALLRDPATLPISKIRVQGVFMHLDENMLRQAVAEKAGQGFFGVDIDAVKQRVEQLPWVAQASVRRIWPDTLGIEVVEQKPLARWAGGGLVNEAGRVFRPVVSSYPSQLPLFSGPENMLATMKKQYRQDNALLTGIGLEIRELRMNSRRALSLHLNNSIELMLGRRQTQARLQRFIIAYKKLLGAHSAEIARVDLRYSNGLSVQWKTTLKQQIYKDGE
ncbi:Cell division protein FtsQ [hydrothermal vent metagenome]|uniref:Cell division protein FtsQ n=1 Tax=hydrothermal vent metagenome TaxID=652676 RepID=A0A3B1B101_9ZZZZ